MRLIDADALKSDHNMGDECNKCKTKWRECQYDYIYSKMDFCTWIDDAPAIDAVEVVHCRDCKYFGEYCDEYKEETQNDGMCELDIKDSVTFDWFCAGGERGEK